MTAGVVAFLIPLALASDTSPLRLKRAVGRLGHL